MTDTRLPPDLFTDYGRTCYEQGYAQGRADLIDSMKPTLDEAASELRVSADELESCHTVDGVWPEYEGEARAAHDRLYGLAQALSTIPKEQP